MDCLEGESWEKGDRGKLLFKTRLRGKLQGTPKRKTILSPRFKGKGEKEGRKRGIRGHPA